MVVIASPVLRSLEEEQRLKRYLCTMSSVDSDYFTDNLRSFEDFKTAPLITKMYSYNTLSSGSIATDCVEVNKQQRQRDRETEIIT